MRWSEGLEDLVYKYCLARLRVRMNVPYECSANHPFVHVHHSPNQLMQ